MRPCRPWSKFRLAESFYLEFLVVAQFDFSPYLHWCLIFKCLPLTPALSPFGGERELNCVTTEFSPAMRFSLDGAAKVGQSLIIR
jgi:hypothetical protein